MNTPETYKFNKISIQGPIIILEDDEDDKEILQDIFASLEVSNELLFFSNGKAALDYLRSATDRPFFILTDMNLPLMNGLELRREILNDEQLLKKAVPYIFLSTSDNPYIVEQAAALQVQGYFRKEGSYEAIRNLIRIIVEYWSLGIPPVN